MHRYCRTFLIFFDQSCFNNFVGFPSLAEVDDGADSRAVKARPMSSWEEVFYLVCKNDGTCCGFFYIVLAGGTTICIIVCMPMTSLGALLFLFFVSFNKKVRLTYSRLQGRRKVVMRFICITKTKKCWCQGVGSCMVCIRMLAWRLSCPNPPVLYAPATSWSVLKRLQRIPVNV